MIIVETQEQKEQALTILGTRDRILIPIFVNPYDHPKNAKVSLIYASTPDGEAFLFGLDHCDVRSSIKIEELRPWEAGKIRTFVPSSRIWNYLDETVQTIDIQGLEYLLRKTPKTLEDFYDFTVRRYIAQNRDTTPHRYVPVMKWIEVCDKYVESISEIAYTPLEYVPGGTFFNNVLLPTCFFMEKDGIRVDVDKMPQHHRKHVDSRGCVYTNHNPYTTTGRITNSFDGWNFVAMNKENGERDAIISRFGARGSMVLIDYESFHLRLIARMIEYTLPPGSVHTHLAEQYFDTTDITPEMYDEGKQLTFKYLYSSEQEGKSIPFFAAVYKFIDDLWAKAVTGHSFYSRTGRILQLKDIHDGNPGKLFNYILQREEMETSIEAISSLRARFAAIKSKVVLYTYDSILIDFCLDDGKEFLYDIIDRLEMNGQFPVKVYRGSTYGQLKNVTNLIKRPLNDE